MSAAATTWTGPRRVARAIGFRWPRIFPWTRFKTSALFLWVLGALATASLVAEIAQGLPVVPGADVLLPEPTYEITRAVLNYKYIIIAVIAQWQLTTLESPLWNKEINLISIVILVVDGCINAGGIFFVLLRFANTPFWRALDVTFEQVGPTMPLIGALVVSFILGALLAAAPEVVWRWSDAPADASAQ